MSARPRDGSGAVAPRSACVEPQLCETNRSAPSQGKAMVGGLAGHRGSMGLALDVGRAPAQLILGDVLLLEGEGESLAVRFIVDAM